ncbi:hypothetical protein HY933_04490 [Candidatus Falkowbacteria bacterium]|nr:hypothetical protein [Candidatus Falkowbacteria bacterium]
MSFNLDKFIWKEVWKYRITVWAFIAIAIAVIIGIIALVGAIVSYCEDQEREERAVQERADCLKDPVCSLQTKQGELESNRQRLEKHLVDINREIKGRETKISELKQQVKWIRVLITYAEVGGSQDQVRSKCLRLTEELEGINAEKEHLCASGFGSFTAGEKAIRQEQCEQFIRKYDKRKQRLSACQEQLDEIDKAVAIVDPVGVGQLTIGNLPAKIEGLIDSIATNMIYRDDLQQRVVLLDLAIHNLRMAEEKFSAAIAYLNVTEPDGGLPANIQELQNIYQELVPQADQLVFRGTEINQEKLAKVKDQLRAELLGTSKKGNDHVKRTK